MLYALEIPKTWGGDTGFLNMYLALETMPDALRQKIEKRSIKQDLSVNSAGIKRRGVANNHDIRTSPGASHPIVRTHPDTGFEALYLGRRRNAYINGLPLEESERLLDSLFEHAARCEFSWIHQWRPGDLIIWDNRCTMHHRDAFDPKSRRVMHRTQTLGTKPYYDEENSQKLPHPRGAAVKAYS
jgi:taurine dioxygenase